MHPSDDRARWLARHILPHEGALRAWLSARPVAGLEIDDIVQETYTRLSLIASVTAIRDPRSYTFRTAHSVMVSFVRHARVVPMHSLAQFEDDRFVDDVPGPEATAIDRDELSRLARAIAALPPRIRAVFMLRRVNGLSQREAAEQLGLSESTVEKHMASGFRRVAELLTGGGNADTGASKGGSRGRTEPDEARDQRGD